MKAYKKRQVHTQPQVLFTPEKSCRGCTRNVRNVAANNFSTQARNRYLAPDTDGGAGVTASAGLVDQPGHWLSSVSRGMLRKYLNYVTTASFQVPSNHPTTDDVSRRYGSVIKQTAKKAIVSYTAM